MCDVGTIKKTYHYFTTIKQQQKIYYFQKHINYGIEELIKSSVHNVVQQC